MKMKKCHCERGEANEAIRRDRHEPINRPRDDRKAANFAGVDIQATPPGKIKDISILSGGERALTSVALLCAILSLTRRRLCFWMRWTRLWMNQTQSVCRDY